MEYVIKDICRINKSFITTDTDGKCPLREGARACNTCSDRSFVLERTYTGNRAVKTERELILV